MADLAINYLGLDLKNPLIVASSKLTSNLDSLRKCEDAGAGAVVLKSLFEEQIVSDSGKMLENLNSQVHAEAYDYNHVMSEEYYLDDYLRLVEEAKQSLSIPVIASLNCITAGKWIDYAEAFDRVGADALELNVFIMPADSTNDGRTIEHTYIDIAKRIKSVSELPVAMKIGAHFTALSAMMHALCDEGIDGLVLFNRFYRPDIDIENLKLIPAKVFSSPEEIALSLQWIALMSGELACDLSATTGIHDSNGVVKQLLAGARTAQLCSTLYGQGIGFIRTILSGLENWMDRHDFSKLGEFRGMLCQERSEHPEAYERSQYIKALTGIS